jgi:maltodextrin utilization protein YvdJ
MTIPLRVKNTFKQEVTSSKSACTIVTEKLNAIHDKVHMQLTGYKIEKKDLVGESDPYVEIFKLADGGKFQLVYKTEVRTDN